MRELQSGSGGLHGGFFGEPTRARSRRTRGRRTVDWTQPSSSPTSSRRHRQLFSSGRQDNIEVYRTLLLNVAAAAKIANSIQPSDSEAGRGLEQIHTLLQAAEQQSSDVSQSLNRLHNNSPRADTVRSVYSPGSPCVAETGVTERIITETRGGTSCLLVITVMTAVGCILLHGAVRMCLDTTMTGARSVMSGLQDLMREMNLRREGSTGAELTEMV